MALVLSQNELERAQQEETARRRKQRLQEVRTQERRIAAETRAAFRQSVQTCQKRLFADAESEWQRQHASRCDELSGTLRNITASIGSAHGAARTTQRVQLAEAAASAATWREGRRRDVAREGAALGEVYAVAASQRDKTKAAAQPIPVPELRAEYAGLGARPSCEESEQAQRRIYST